MKIVILDDDMDLCMLLKLFFEKRGYTVFTANSLKTGLQLIDDHEVSLAEKNKTIQQLRQELIDAGRIKSKVETENDNLKNDKQAALDRAQRAEDRYVKNTELKSRSEQQEKDLLNKLFD